MLSKACKYALKSVIYIATESIRGNRVKIGDIIDQIDSPEAFTGKILGELSKNKIINSHKGPYGGFDISIDKMKSTSVATIIESIDGQEAFTDCILGLKKCDNKTPCPLHKAFASGRNKLRITLENTTTYQLANDVINGKAVLIRSLKID